MKLIKWALVIVGLSIAFLSVPVENLAAEVLLVFVGFGLAASAMQIPTPRRYVTRYYKSWDSTKKAGIDPIDPLVDCPAEYVRIVPQPERGVAKVSVVRLPRASTDDRSEERLEEVPLELWKDDA